MKEIKKIGIIAIAKIMSLLYLIGSGIFMLPYSLIVLAGGGATKENVRWWFFALMPFFYYLVSFLVIIAGAFFYNLLAGKIGGIKIELTEEENVTG